MRALCCPRRLAPSPPEACGLRGRPSPPVRAAIMRAAALAAGWAFALLASAAGGSTDAVRLFMSGSSAPTLASTPCAASCGESVRDP